MHQHHAFVCTRTLYDIGCECMVWVDSMFSVDLGESTLCLVFDGVSWVHGYKSTLRLVLDWVGPVNGTTPK